MAIGYLRTLGGSAYMPDNMIANEVEAGRLHRVAGAPQIEHSAYAVYLVRGPRTKLIERILPIVGEVT